MSSYSINHYKFIDLFAGLGGFHLALQALGHECVFASELKEDLQTLYKQNFPKTPIFGDITQIDPKTIPPHDIICAGFPCQPFSQAGKREKALMTRNREVRYLTIFVQSLLHIGPNILYSKMYKTSRITTTAIHGK